MLDSRPGTASPASPATRALATDAAVVVGVLVLLGVLAGLVWPQLVDPVVYVRTRDDVVSDEVALAEQFDDEAWYAVLAAVVGVVAGTVLSLWRRRDPLATVLLLVVGAGLAGVVMAAVGTALGPPPAVSVLEDARVGATAPDAVVLRASSAYLVWPIATLFGAVVVLWSRRSP